MIRALALLALIIAAPASAQVAVAYRTYEGFHDSTGVGQHALFDDLAASLVADEFALVGRPAPRVAGANGTEPVAEPGERLFEIHAFSVDEGPPYSTRFLYVELHEATGVGPGYLTWNLLDRTPEPLPFPGPDARETTVRAAARAVIAQMGWTPEEPPPPAPDSFWVAGPNPSTTGVLVANVPSGWEVRWLDALGRVVATTATTQALPSGTYFAQGMVRATRARHTRRVLVVRS